MDFPADLERLDEIMCYIHEQGTCFDLDDKTLQKIELAAEEAVVNIISYAYPDVKGSLTVTCTFQNNQFEVTLRDYGVPFNPIEAKIDPQQDVPVEERKIGGLGIYLLRKLIHDASYTRENDENVLHLIFLTT